MQELDLKAEHDKQNSVGVLEQIIEQGFNLFCLKYAKGGIVTRNEYSFQFELGVILKQLGQLYEFNPEDKFEIKFESNIELSEISKKSLTNKARIDIFINYKQYKFVDVQAAIELKFLKKESKKEPVSRYDVFADISNLESYKESGIEVCYLLLITDNNHYVNHKKYSKKTSDFDFRQGVTYKSNTVLSYRTEKSKRKDIVLTKDYEFKWLEYEELSFLKIRIP